MTDLDPLGEDNENRDAETHADELATLRHANAELLAKCEALQVDLATVTAERDALAASAESEDDDGKGGKAVRLKKRFVAHGSFGTILFKENQIVRDPQTIRLLRSLKAPLGKV